MNIKPVKLIMWHKKQTWTVERKWIIENGLDISEFEEEL